MAVSVGNRPRDHEGTVDSTARSSWVMLAVVGGLFVTVSAFGMTWGLPTSRIDNYLFGEEPPWPGEKIYRLAHADGKFSPARGADVDVDPLVKSTSGPILLTATEEDVAKIYLRYRLYTYQPDEMITMMALAGMRPGKLDFDPRLYQYGGLFIYPVGALIKACDAVGLIDVRSDVAYYLDRPDEFGKFYLVARAYSAASGLIGVFVVFAIGRRLAGARAGVIAAWLFTLMPVVICMAHEGKPHLPGAVLMLAAVLFAIRCVEPHRGGHKVTSGAKSLSQNPRSVAPRGLKPAAQAGLGIGFKDAVAAVDESPGAGCSGRNWWLMCICCGAALGMVLSSLPIFILIPLIAWLTTPGRPSTGAVERSLAVTKRTLAGIAAAGCVYLISNPYIVINTFVNREVLRSNFGNSLAMYEIARIPEGFIRVLELTSEGATPFVLVIGVIALIRICAGRNRLIVPLVVPAAVFFLQFVLIGAGKPAEYGRFGIFANTALAIGVAGVLGQPWLKRHGGAQGLLVIVITLFMVGSHGGDYLANFCIDAGGQNSRTQLAREIAACGQGGSPAGTVAVLAEPAPYCCPPMDFSRRQVLLLSSPEDLSAGAWRSVRALLQTVDRPAATTDGLEPAFGRVWPAQGWPPPTPISWANKPFRVSRMRGMSSDPVSPGQTPSSPDNP